MLMAVTVQMPGEQVNQERRQQDGAYGGRAEPAGDRCDLLGTVFVSSSCHFARDPTMAALPLVERSRRYHGKGSP